MPVQQEPEEPDETPVHYGPPPPRPPATEPAPPAPEPSEPAPEPEIPKTAHLPEDFDPIRERGPAGSYTRTKHSMRFDRLTDPQDRKSVV